MIDVETQERLTVHTEGNAGPYIMVSVNQLQVVEEILEKDNIPYWTDDDAISVDGKPEVAIINIGAGVDGTRVQGILDAA